MTLCKHCDHSVMIVFNIEKNRFESCHAKLNPDKSMSCFKKCDCGCQNPELNDTL